MKTMILLIAVFLGLRILFSIIASLLNIIAEIFCDATKIVYLEGTAKKIFSGTVSFILSIPLLIITSFIAIGAVIFSIFKALFEFLWKTPTTSKNFWLKLGIIWLLFSLLSALNI